MGMIKKKKTYEEYAKHIAKQLGTHTGEDKFDKLLVALKRQYKDGKENKEMMDKYIKAMMGTFDSTLKECYKLIKKCYEKIRINQLMIDANFEYGLSKESKLSLS